MRIGIAALLGTLLALILSVSTSAQQPVRPEIEDVGRFSKILREACVAFERTAVATDTNDSSHLKGADWMDGRYCQGFIQGFELGANHTVYALSEPKRLEIFTSQHTTRQLAKALVTFIDEHPDKVDPRDILLGALQEAHAAALFGNIKMQDLTPDCPKDWKDMPAGGCTLRPDTK